jgi:Ca-activated chloride channel family protein
MDRVMEWVDGQLFGNERRRAHPLTIATSPKARKRSLSPYFRITGDGDDRQNGQKASETLPLEKTSAEISVVGVICRVVVRQVYRNTGTSPIEAIYVFPGSTRAAVHDMKMKIGKRVIRAEIEETRTARKIYAKAKREGKRASLLQQKRANVFTMKVANIMPKDRIEVELVYSELLVPEDGIYEIVYPAVVGPRYGRGADPDEDEWISSPYLPKGQPPTYDFAIETSIESPIPIKGLSSPSHRITPKFDAPNRAELAISSSSAPKAGDRDFVLRYRLRDNRIQTGVMTAPSGEERKKGGYFLVMMEPPKTMRAKEIPPREYIFILDVSGSMRGFPLRTAKSLLRELMSEMRPQDYFNVVLFAGTAHLMSPRSLPASKETLKRALRVIERQRGGGGTELLSALETAYRVPAARRDVARSLIVISDGYVAVEARTFRMVRKNLSKASCFAFGIGSSVNRALIEGLARAGMGEPFVASSKEEASKAARRFRKYVSSPALTDIRLAFKGVEPFDVIPQNPPDLLARRPLVIMGKYSGDLSGSLVVKGMTGRGAFEKTIPLEKVGTKSDHAPLSVLWARKWAAELMDQLALLADREKVRSAIVQLGLSHRLLTRYTSFVAVDTKRVNPNGEPEVVRQPLPLPAGVPTTAVGGRAAAPQPSPGCVKARRELAMKAPPVRSRSRGCHCRHGAGSSSTPSGFAIWMVLAALLGLVAARARPTRRSRRPAGPGRTGSRKEPLCDKR